MSQISSQDQEQQPATAPPSLPKVLGAALVGNFVEWFDFALFAYAVPTIAVLFFTSSDSAIALLYTYMTVYGISFVIRPLGAMFWGHVGDRIGRRNTLAIVLITMGGATALVGVLPTAESIGLAAPALLLLLRLIQAFSAGGEGGGAFSFVIEQVPLRRRGTWLVLVNSCAVVPFVVAAFVIQLLTSAIGEDGFLDHGWRVPFLLGGVVALVGLFIRLRMIETSSFRTVAKHKMVQKLPLVTCFRECSRAMFGVFLILGAGGLAFYLLAGFINVYLSESLGFSRQAALLSNGGSLALIAVFAPLFALWGDHIGRRRPLIIAGYIALVLTTIPGFLLAENSGVLGAIAWQATMAISLSLLWAGAIPTMTEAFPTRVRYTGVGVSTNLGYAVFAGTAPPIAQHLTESVGLLAPAVYATTAFLVLGIVSVFVVEETARLPLLRSGDGPDTV